MKQKIIFFFVILISGYSSGQAVSSKNYTKQVTITTENDRYLFQKRDGYYTDGYYTNGFIINYSSIQKSNKPYILKQIHNYEVGQKIYTAYGRRIFSPTKVDRPITGYLDFKFLQSNFLVRQQIFQWGISIGTIGNSSLGKFIQNDFHKMINVKESPFWDYQLKDEPGVNLLGNYAISLLKKPSFIQVSPVLNAILGTTFTNISQGVFFQLGKFNRPNESSYWNAALQDSRSLQEGTKMEVMLYYYPQILYQQYNATVQGGMFRKDKGPIVSIPERWVITNSFGVLFSKDRYSLKAEVNMQSKEAVTQRFPHAYGTIQAAVRFL